MTSQISEERVSGEYIVAPTSSGTAKIVLVAGGGGGGGQGNLFVDGGGGGGGGGGSMLISVQLEAFTIYRITVGKGGAGDKHSSVGESSTISVQSTGRVLAEVKGGEPGIKPSNGSGGAGGKGGVPNGGGGGGGGSNHDIKIGGAGGEAGGADAGSGGKGWGRNYSNATGGLVGGCGGGGGAAGKDVAGGNGGGHGDPGKGGEVNYNNALLLSPGVGRHGYNIPVNPNPILQGSGGGGGGAQVTIYPDNCGLGGMGYGYGEVTDGHGGLVTIHFQEKMTFIPIYSKNETNMVQAPTESVTSM